jgi:hypothetical protein
VSRGTIKRGRRLRLRPWLSSNRSYRTVVTHRRWSSRNNHVPPSGSSSKGFVVVSVASYLSQSTVEFVSFCMHGRSRAVGTWLCQLADGESLADNRMQEIPCVAQGEPCECACTVALMCVSLQMMHRPRVVQQLRFTIRTRCRIVDDDAMDDHGTIPIHNEHHSSPVLDALLKNYSRIWKGVVRWHLCHYQFGEGIAAGPTGPGEPRHNRLHLIGRR